MTENARGQQSSGNNIPGRRLPHAPIHDPSTSARPTGRISPAVPINGTAPSHGAVLNRRTVPNGRIALTNRTIPTGRSAPTSLTTPTGRSAPAGCTTPTGRTIPTGCTNSTSITVPIGPADRIGSIGSTGSAVPTSCSACTSSTAPTSPAVQMGSAISTGSSVPASPAPTSHTVNTSRAAQARPTRPTYPSLLKLQAEHRSQCVIEGEYLNPLSTRRHIMYLPWDPRYEKYVIASGLYGVHKIGHIPTDHALVSALVERWREETHTFHFPIGEMTITLQDVALLLGLRVNGEAICLRTDRDWLTVVHSLLGRADSTTFRKKSKVAINISWLLEHFSVCPLNADPITVQQFARAYCFVLVGSVLFTDHSGDSISAIYLPLFANFNRAGRYSWASGVLAYLYKELCLATKPKRRQFGGSVMLLQLWSWERLPMGRPTTRRNAELPQLGGEDLSRRPPLGYGWSFEKRFADHVTCRVMESYRCEIDGLIDSNVTWLPYEDRMHLLPSNCREEDRALWRTTAPLIHFWIVEMYNPGRVGRQFDRYQNVPPFFRDTDEDLHQLINGTGENWPDKHAKHLEKWRIRQYLCLRDQRPYDHSRHEAYMRWFSGASILYLSSPGGVPNTDSSVSSLQNHASCSYFCCTFNVPA
jgi:Plant mobile domain